MPQVSSIKIYNSANDEEWMRKRRDSGNKWFINGETNHRRIMTKWFPWELICICLPADLSDSQRKLFPIKNIDDSVERCSRVSRQIIVDCCLATVGHKRLWKKKMNRGNFPPCFKLATNYTQNVSARDETCWSCFSCFLGLRSIRDET